MKSNKVITFFKSLGVELDEEIIKGIKEIGTLKIILGVGGFFLIRYLLSFFGYQEYISTFYFYSIFAFLLFLVWYASELKKTSKLKFIIDYGGQILMLIISAVIVVALLYGIIIFILDAFNWVIEFLN